MAVELHSEADGKILQVRISGRLDKDDYGRFVPEVEHLVQQHGKLRMLVETHDFQGWDAGALWEDIKFSINHFNNIERLAIVGEKTWEKGMAIFCKPFTTAKVKYFDHSEIDQARLWIAAGQTTPAA
jgi:hypothetical protein